MNLIKKIRNLTVGQLYVFLTVLCVTVFFICVFFSSGDLLSEWFFGGKTILLDDRDTGMDFFNSIIYLKDNDPYLKYHTLYPPLANLFFKLLYHMIPDSITSSWADDYEDVKDMRGAEGDIRTYQPPLVLFIFFIVFTVLTLTAVSDRFCEKSDDPLKKWIPACTVLSYGVLYSLERGNIILISCIFSMIFVLWYQSSNRILREIALISLAIAAGLKLYPALFGLLLIRNKQYKDAGRAIIYGVLSVILPCFAFNGGLTNFPEWLKIALSGGGGRDCLGIMDILSTVTMITDRFGFFYTPSPTVWTVSSILTSLIQPFVILFPVLAFFYAKSAWERVLTLEVLMILLFHQGTYVCCFFIIPLLVYMQEHPASGVDKTPLTILIMLLFILPVPLFGTAIRLLLGIVLFAVLYISLVLHTLSHLWNRITREKISLHEIKEIHIKRGK